MSDSDSVYVVGGGVFGQVIAGKLRKDGHKVTVFDRREKEAGSLPSGGHIRPSWISSVSGPTLERSLETLDKLFGVEKLECYIGIPPILKKFELMRVDVEKVLRQPVVEANVTQVGDGWLLADGERYRGTVIVAAGVWCKQLLPRVCPDLFAKKGMSWVFQGGKPVDNIVRPWAPYKQIVRTSHGPGRTWIGDGTALLQTSWNPKAEAKIEQRVLPFAPPNYTNLTRHYGLRPYLETHSDALQHVSKKLWLATGGAKSGTALAGVVANQLAEALK